MSGPHSDDLSHDAHFEVVNRLGLHARAAMLLAQTAGRFAARVTVTKDAQTVDGKSLLELMLLQATRGTRLQIVAVGPDAVEAVKAIGDLISERFHEAD
jgi:phosphotransferase system HPr (HPr) family protein